MSAETPIQMTGREFNSKYTTPLLLKTNLDSYVVESGNIVFPLRKAHIIEGNNYHPNITSSTPYQSGDLSFEGVPIDMNLHSAQLVNRYQYESAQILWDDYNFYLWDIQIPDHSIINIFRNKIYATHFKASNRRSVFDLTEDELQNLILENQENLKWIQSQEFKNKGGRQVQWPVPETIFPSVSSSSSSWKGRIRAFGFDFFDF